MAPVTSINLIATMAMHAPVYMNAAAQTTDPVRRMKFVMVQSLSFIYSCHTFAKPLNPILGETYEGFLEDGSIVYMEQVSHHPPISYMLTEGPGKNYKWYGYSSFTPKASLNSISLNVKGTKYAEFPDGTKISYDPTGDTFQNTIMGTVRHIINGKCHFKDIKNGLTGWYHIGGAGKKVPCDYLVGEILKDGVVVSKMYGHYFGYFDFDGERFWDIRD